MKVIGGDYLARRKLNACANEWTSPNILQNTVGNLTPLSYVAFDWLASRFATSVTIFYMFNHWIYGWKVWFMRRRKNIIYRIPDDNPNILMQISHSHNNIHHQHHHRIIEVSWHRKPFIILPFQVKSITGWACSAFLSSFKRMGLVWKYVLTLLLHDFSWNVIFK